MMLRVTDYGRAPIEYGLERSSRRTLMISVLPDCSVRVVAPIEADLKEIDDRVRRRARWISTAAGQGACPILRVGDFTLVRSWRMTTASLGLIDRCH
jgi:hypothetical protein